MTDHEIIHRICQAIRANHFAGVRELHDKCDQCPALIVTTHGSGTQACYEFAQAIFDIAHQRS